MTGSAQETPESRTRASITWCSVAYATRSEKLMDCLLLREPLFFASQVITGLATGGVYALVALGFVLIYKASDVINFAQGDLLLVGAYVGWALTTAGLPFPIAFVLTLGVAGLVGLLVERLVLR